MLFQNKQKNIYTEKGMHMNIKQNKNKRRENIFNKKKKIVLES
jgi:predicted lipase